MITSGKIATHHCQQYSHTDNKFHKQIYIYHYFIEKNDKENTLHVNEQPCVGKP